jgi:hypothetical protein
MAEFPPPQSVEPHVRDWMNERDFLLQTWNRSMIEWDKKYIRSSTCNLDLAGERVEITEHETVVKDL